MPALRTLRGNGRRELPIVRGDLPAGVYMVIVNGPRGPIGSARVVME